MIWVPTFCALARPACVSRSLNSWLDLGGDSKTDGRSNGDTHNIPDVIGLKSVCIINKKKTGSSK